MKREGVLVMCISILVLIIIENNNNYYYYMVGATFPSSANDVGGGQGGGGGGGMPFQFPIFPTSPNGAGAGAGGFQLPGGGGGGGGLGMGEMGPEHKKCFESFQKDGLGLPCLQDLGNSFQTQRISLSPACCSFLSNIDEACKPLVHFQNPFFKALVQKHCCQRSSIPTDSSSPGTIINNNNGGSTIFSDQTGAAAAAAAQSPSSTLTSP